VNTSPRRIVVLAPNWLGDLVMALPAIGDLRRAHPAAHLAVAARSPLAPLAEAIPGVNDVVPLTSTGGLRSLGTSTADSGRLRNGAFDAALVLPNSFHAAWLVRRAGIPRRWGYRADLRSRLLTTSVPKPRGRRMHQAEYYQQLTRALGMTPGPLRPQLTVAAAARDGAMALLGARGWKGERLVGLAPGAAYGWAKRWPPERMGALAARIIRTGARAIIVGAAADRPTADAVRRAAAREAAGYGLIDVAGATDLLTLLGVLACCDVFVSNDSGAMHLAAAVDVPVVGIFGPTREWATAPLPSGGAAVSIVKTDVWCRPCMLRNCPIDHRCMTGIAVDDVYAHVGEVLSRTGGREGA
jgi:heptosyltransferase II